MNEPVKPNPCKSYISVITDGPKYTAKCHLAKCEWTKTAIISDTGINMGALQREHDGDF